jgi:hypothetical protein
MHELAERSNAHPRLSSFGYVFQFTSSFLDITLFVDSISIFGTLRKSGNRLRYAICNNFCTYRLNNQWIKQ